MKLGPVDYQSKTPPDTYHCSGCGAEGCKLWRQVVFSADHVHLFCSSCAGKDQKIDVSGIDDEGRATCPSIGERTDQLGNLLPAVPDESGTTFWGYTSASPEAVAWWKALPSTPEKAFLSRLKHNLKTQDNASTAWPMFIVQQKRRITGFDTQWTESIGWFDTDGEADEETSARLEAVYDSTGEDLVEEYQRTGYLDEWEFVTACFTEQGCLDYLKRNGHNLKEPRIFVESGHRNEEWIKLRAYLMGARP